MKPSPSSPSLPAQRPVTEEERRARLHEEQVYPLVGQRLADLLVAGLVLPARCRLLEIGCGLGPTITEILHKLDAESRFIVGEASAALVERVRATVSESQTQRRVFFRAHHPERRLPFADHAFDVVLASLELHELSRPESVVAELARVTRPGGQVRLAALLRGTWQEFLDVYRDVLVRLHRDDALASLRGYAGSFPEADGVVRLMEGSGVAAVTVERERWELLFRSAREFFYAPVVEQGPLPRWKRVAGKGLQVQDTFLAVKQAIETYYAGRPFAVGVSAGLFCGTRSA
jgi:SAM-dependent methyltransferase